MAFTPTVSFLTATILFLLVSIHLLEISDNIGIITFVRYVFLIAAVWREMTKL